MHASFNLKTDQVDAVKSTSIKNLNRSLHMTCLATFFYEN